MATLSLWGLFMQADIVVKLVMLGLLSASVWVWAVVFEKWTTLRKVNKDADGFEDRFWSGGSLDELFDREGTNPNNPMAVGVRRRDGRMAPFGARRRRRHLTHKCSRTNRPRDHCDGAAGDGPHGAVDDLPRQRRRHRPVHRPVRHRLGHHALVLRHRGHAQHQPRGGRPRHRRGAVRHRHRPGGGDPGGARLQPDQQQPVPLRRPAGQFRQRIQRHPVPPKRGTEPERPRVALVP